MSWSMMTIRPMMLGLFATLLLGACQSSPTTDEKFFAFASSPSVSDPTTTRDARAEADAAPHAASADAAEKTPREPSAPITAPTLERPAAESHPSPERNAATAHRESQSRTEDPDARSLRLRLDPGAARLVRSIRDRVSSHADRRREPERAVPIVIRIDPIRNLSRARSDEFAAFLDRFATLLSDTGRSSGLMFSSRPDVDATYELAGTAYLLSADGFDWWELFLHVRPADERLMIWRSEHPIRVLRHPRPEHQQVFLVPPARSRRSPGPAFTLHGLVISARTIMRPRRRDSRSHLRVRCSARTVGSA